MAGEVTPEARLAELALYRAHWIRVRDQATAPDADRAARANAELAAHWIRNVDRAISRVRLPGDCPPPALG